MSIKACLLGILSIGICRAWCFAADNPHPSPRYLHVKAQGAAEAEPDYAILHLAVQPGEVRGEGGFGMVFHGDHDKLVVCRDGTRIPADPKARQFKLPPGGTEVYRMDKHADYNMNHKEDFFEAILSGKKPCMGIEVGHRVATMNNLGNLSYLLGRKLAWDAKREQVLDDDQANRLLARPQRYPYHL